jgi:phosphoglycerate dehydrogenase-like enzyme
MDASSRPAQSPECLLAALTPAEWRDFLPEPAASELKTLARRTQVIDPATLSPAAFAQALADANPEVLVAAWKTPPLPTELPPRLRYVCYLCGSVRRLVTRRHVENGLQVTNWGNSISRVVAEGALFHVLSCLRRGPAWALAMHLEGAWKTPEAETASLFGRRVGIHGFGNVAREFIRLIAPFGARVTVFAPDVDEAAQAALGVSRTPSLESLFAENDIIVELAPYHAKNHHIVTEKLLRSIKPGGAFINIGRGAVVDEAAMIRVATDRRDDLQIGLDVYETEPLPADSALRGLSNVALLPHIAGPTKDRRQDTAALAVENLTRFVRSEQLHDPITLDVYDRAT